MPEPKAAPSAPRTGKPGATRGRKASAPRQASLDSGSNGYRKDYREHIVSGFKQHALWGFGAAATVAVSSLLTYYIASDNSGHSTSAANTLFADRNFNQAPFDANDASRACEAESKRKFGDTLLRSNVNWHSTRFDEQRKLWLVVLDSDVGNLEQFDNASIYCYINPRTYEVSYFKAYDSESRVLGEKVGFDFEDIVSFFK